VLDGTLVHDGSAAGSLLLAPFVVPGADFAVEVEIRLMCAEAYGGVFEILAGLDAAAPDPGGTGFGAGFQTAGEGAGPLAILTCGHDLLIETPRPIDNDWHTIRLEARGRALRFLVDGRLAGAADLPSNATGDRFGLWSDGAPLRARAVRVLPLDRGEIGQDGEAAQPGRCVAAALADRDRDGRGQPLLTGESQDSLPAIRAASPH
jgi:hypothetical protein